ncbi:MAG: HNH endonuclease [Azoarcus sp.]|nr:HNH endonuclease [Azoarcus sp.]
MSLISYPRTAAALAALLKIPYRALLDLIRKQKVRVNIAEFMRALFKDQQNNDRFVAEANDRLMKWFEARRAAGDSDAAIVYHRSGVRLLHGFTIEKVSYTRKRDRNLYRKERSEFDSTVKGAWLREVARTHRAELLSAGLGDAQVDAMARDGKAPEGYQVHHRIPLDDGGTNAPDNLILMRNDVEHRAIHGYYNPGEKCIQQMAYGACGEVALPLPPRDAVIYPNPSRQWVAERRPSLDLYEIYK